MDRAHYLSVNHSGNFPSRILCLDTETIPDVVGNYQYHRMRLGISVYCDIDKDTLEPVKEEWQFFYTQKSMCEYIQSKGNNKKPLYVFASNPSFDLGAIAFAKYFTGWGWELEAYAQKGLVFLLCIKKDDKCIKIMALQNFIPTGIKGVGRMVGLEKHDIDVFTDDLDLLSIYCFRDVEILLHGIIYYMHYIKCNDLGRFAVTKSSQAMHAFRHRFMTHKILIHKNPSLSELERDSYYGGRVECFRLGEQLKQDYVYLDINSMYPYVMQRYTYPTKPVGIIQKGNMRQLRYVLSHYCVIARVKICTNEPVYPYRQGKSCIYPVGTFWTSLTTRSLRYALEHNHIVDVSTGIYYTSEPLFKQYVDFFWSERQYAKLSGNKAQEQLIKLFLNSLYGKFGEQREICIHDEHVDTEENSLEYWYDETTDTNGYTLTLFHRRLVCCGKRDTDNTVVSIASHVTDDARMVLWGLMQRVGYDNVYYVDTDSLITTSECAREKLGDCMGTELGQLKIEQSSEHLTINALKDYIFGETVKCKGIHSGSVRNSDNTYDVTQFLSFRNAIEHGVSDATLVRVVKKELSRTYDKGIISPDLRVFPWVLDVQEDTKVFSPALGRDTGASKPLPFEQ